MIEDDVRGVAVGALDGEEGWVVWGGGGVGFAFFGEGMGAIGAGLGVVGVLEEVEFGEEDVGGAEVEDGVHLGLRVR